MIIRWAASCWTQADYGLWLGLDYLAATVLYGAMPSAQNFNMKPREPLALAMGRFS